MLVKKACASLLELQLPIQTNPIPVPKALHRTSQICTDFAGSGLSNPIGQAGAHHRVREKMLPCPKASSTSSMLNSSVG